MNRLSSKPGRPSCHQAQVIREQILCWGQWLLSAVFLLLFMAGCSGGEPSAEVAVLEAKLTQQAQEAEMPAVEEPAGEQPAIEEPAAQPQAEQAAEPPPAETEEQPAQEVVEETAVSSSAPTVDVQATGTADALRQTAEAEQASMATAEAELAATLEPIRAEVATYGVDPNQGSLGFTHPPISIEVTDFEDAAFRNQNLFTVARDFVLAADVTWNSAYASSGCGFVVRNDGEEENPSQYIIGLTRGAEGHLLFAEQVAGDFDLRLLTDIYAGGIDPQFEWQNGSSNRIAIVGRGQAFTIYSNGTRLGTITGQSGLEEGFVAFFAVNRSGGIRCDFDNAWLWRMN